MGFKNVEVRRDQNKIQAVAKERNKVVQGIRAKALEEVLKHQEPKTSQEDLMVAAAEARNKQELPDRGGDNEGKGTGRPPNAASLNDDPESPTVKRGGKGGNPSDDLIPAGYGVKGTDADKHNKGEGKGDEKVETEEDEEETDKEDLDGMTVQELKDLAHEEEIQLHGASTKADIIKAIKKGRK